MRFAYREWDAALAEHIRSLESLRRLFYRLLLHTRGDVEEALAWMEALRAQGRLPPDWDLEAFRRQLEEDRVIETQNGAPALTGRGERTLRRESLELVFGKLTKGPAGEHATRHAGRGGERLSETRPYRFGDSLGDLDPPGTVRNALHRGIDDIRLTEDDFEVFETEHRTSTATVVLLDISHSMVLYGEDRMTPAKTVALALAELILTRYPKDSLEVAVFGDDAEAVPLDRLPYLDAGPYHTNTKAGLRLAMAMLRRKKHPHKQIVLITDGKPSCLWEEGRLYKNAFGLDPKIVNRTLDEAVVCRRRGISITTFMVASDPDLVRFVEEMTRQNRGRAFYTGLDELGSAVLHDFVRHRKRRLR